MRERLSRCPSLEIRRSGLHGWGVFAAKKISSGDVLEEVPFQRLGMDSMALESVRYYWPRNEPWEGMAVPAGFAMLYNHSEDANADWETVEEDLLFRFFAIRDIRVDEEILIDYGGNYPW